VVGGVAEALPFKDASFDLVLLVTTICFVDDARRTFQESRRIRGEGGPLIVGLVDQDSALGRAYERHGMESLFYRGATFRSAKEVLALMREQGFDEIAAAQTIFRELRAIDGPEPVREGC